MLGEEGLGALQGPGSGRREGHSVRAPLGSCQEELGGGEGRSGRCHGSGVCRASSGWGRNYPEVLGVSY